MARGLAFVSCRCLFTTVLAAATLSLGVLPADAPAQAGKPDPRRVAHGMSAVRAADGDTLIFHSAGRMPAPGEGWHHDIVVSRWQDGTLQPAEPFIVREEAQEPASAAQSTSGNILVTFEDGWDARGTVTQRYGVYTDTLDPIAPYPLEVKPGGHSGHVAAVGDRFVVVFSDEWVHGGGVDDLGSGFGVYARIYDDAGKELHALALADEEREWWPIVAGGERSALMVWQRFVPGSEQAKLIAAPVDPRTGQAGASLLLHTAIDYYTYQSAWLPGIERFLVMTTAGDEGFAYLLDAEGRLTATLDCLPPTVREADIAVAPGADGETAVAYTPGANGGLVVVKARADHLEAGGTLQDDSDESWPVNGSLGLFTAAGEIDWIYFSGSDLASRRFDPTDAQEPTGCSDPSED